MSSSNQNENTPKSMIDNIDLPELNKIVPYAANFVKSKPYQGKKKVCFKKPVYVTMNKDDVKSVIKGFLFPRSYLRRTNVNILANYATSRCDPVHQYHCFQFMKIYVQQICNTIGPRYMLRFLDLLALCVYKYSTGYPSLRNFEPGFESEWNKQYKYQHY